VSSVLDARQLLREAIERESADLRRTVELYVYRFTTVRAPDRLAELAAEILQDVVVRALANAQAFDPARRPLPWLLGIALNVVRERSREQRREAETRYQPDVRTGADSPADPLADVLSRLHDRESTSAYGVIELLDLVDARDREVLRLVYVEGLPGPALAERLGIKEGAARVRLSRALQRLARAYREANQLDTQPTSIEEPS
jgi:RNA polymerase sigma-70 factor (ECF subfamily)